MALFSERFSLQTRRDGVRQHRNAVLEEVQNEVNKIHYTRTPTVFTYSEICQIIQRLRI